MITLFASMVVVGSAFRRGGGIWQEALGSCARRYLLGRRDGLVLNEFPGTSGTGSLCRGVVRCTRVICSFATSWYSSEARQV